MKELSTHAELKAKLLYSKRTGLFTWKVRTGARGLKATVAGHVHKDSGYRTIKTGGRHYRAARLAWFYVTGQWPTHDIDHKNGIRSDDRFRNLRDVPTYVNVQNERKARSNNQHKVLGVLPSRTKGKFVARIGLPDGTKKWLGTFSTVEQAGSAYLVAKRQLHEGCTL